MPTQVVYPPGDITVSGGAQESTLNAIRNHLDQVETLLAAIRDDNTVSVDNMIPAVETGLAKEATLGTRASEATLVQVRDYLDGVETLLAAIRDDNTVAVDNFPATQGVSLTGLNYVSPTTARKLGEGKVFTSGGSPSSTLTATGDFVIRNPVGNTKVVYVVSWTIGASATTILTYLKNPTVTGGSARPVSNLNFASAVTATAEVLIGQGIISGGADLGPRHQVAATRPVEKEVLVVLPPGASVGIQLPAGASVTGTAAIQWYEE